MHIDFIDALPGSTGLYPIGLEEVSRTKDVTGRVRLGCRGNFLLTRMTQRQQDNAEHARWLLDFQKWVQQQSAAGTAPVFGDVPQQERICARKGRLQKCNEAGAGKYTVELTVEFTKYY